MDDHMVGSGGQRRMARALITAGVLLGLALPWQAAAQIPTPVGEIPIPTTLPPVPGGGDGGGGGGGGGIVTPPPVTTPTTVAPTPPTTVADEQERTEPTPPAAGRTVTSTRRPSTARPAGAPVPGDDTVVQRAVADPGDRRAITRLREVSVPAARQFGFPLVLGGFVLAFLVVQGRLDARDPKLAAAPVTVDDDLLPFV